jgi:hypothetical protein
MLRALGDLCAPSTQCRDVSEVYKLPTMYGVVCQVLCPPQLKKVRGNLEYIVGTPGSLAWRAARRQGMVQLGSLFLSLSISFAWVYLFVPNPSLSP